MINNINVNYTGFDINLNLLKVASELYPDGNFVEKDIQNEGIDRDYDYIISSQTFNNKLINEDNSKIMEDVIRICYESSKIAFAIDMLTTYVDFKEDNLYYYSPEEMFSYSKKITKRVCLRHDYPCYEFALFLYKDFTGWML